jgi:hypothetical protein
MHLAAGGRRHVLAVDCLGQPVDRDQVVGAEQQGSQHRLLAGTPHLHQLRSRRQLKRSQKPELHPITRPYATSDSTASDSTAPTHIS